MNISDYVCILCNDLSVEKPKIRFVPRLTSRTQLAELKWNNGNPVISVRNSLSDADIAFSIAHELRHLYQIKNKGISDGYAKPNSVDVSTYNDQEEELDANAYAAYTMISMFGIKPTFNGLSKETVEKIYDRMFSLYGKDSE